MRTWAIVLAAGSGRRFGGDKLTTEFRGRPLLAHCLDAVSRAVAERILESGVVVRRARDQAVADLAVSSGLQCVAVALEGAGLAESLRTGLSALSLALPDGALVVPGDQPLLRLDVIKALLSEVAGGDAAVVRPVYQEEPDVPGHPVWLARSVWPLAAELLPDQGFSRILSHHGIVIRTARVPGRNPDADTRERLASLESEP
jgi:CTP:molybdopterin cytidylyltransferase MocA